MNVPTVLYVARKVNAPRFHRAFLESLIHHPAGADFQLLYVLKGYAPEEQDRALESLRARLPCTVETVRYSDAVSPSLVYFELGKTRPLLLALNSWSRILAPGWLRFYTDAFAADPSCGLVGATGSREGIPTAPFPNPALRTNAFMMRGETMKKLDLGGLESRAGSLLFEAGPNSLTRQIQRLGLSALVVDRTGKLWPQSTWNQSETFRTGQQSGLLVADNRTAQYQHATLRRRRKLTALAWGNADLAEAQSITKRISGRYSWFYPEGWRDVLNRLQEGGVTPR
jgi:hypothetical protein